MGTQLDDWLAARRIEASTKAGYESAVEFWRESIGAKPLRALRHSQVLTARNARPELTGKTINNFQAKFLDTDLEGSWCAL